MLHIIVNPVAGNGLGARVGGQMTQRLDDLQVPYVRMETEYEGHATVLARAAAEAGAETVIATGGDGTVLETVRGIYGTQAALGVIPAGTGNDVIKMLGVPAKPAEALDFILQKPARPLDAARINESLFLNVSGTGFDVSVLEYALVAKRYVRGMLPYLWGLIRTIFSYKPVELTIRVDDEPPVRKKLLIVAVANGRFIGGGMNIAPVARPDDGLFDIVMIDNMPRWKLPTKLVKFLTGRVRDIPGTSYRNCRRVVIEGTDIHMNIDGEIVPMDRAEMEILPKALLAHW